MTAHITAYLGPEGTFTETAARAVTKHDTTAKLLACHDIPQVFRHVSDGLATQGVVPIENTLEGSVTATLDALAAHTDLLITAEHELAVELVAAAPNGTTLDAVTAVYSHPVPLAGCSQWLSRLTGSVERVSMSSTARAAEHAAEQGIGHVAIVNRLAAERYGLSVLADAITDRDTNTTRFVVVGTELPAPTGWDKTSVVVYIDTNRPGALLKLLEVFAERDLNLTKIESRPTKAELGEYCFFVDVEGHVLDARVGDALAAVRRTQRDITILGSYPRATPFDAAAAQHAKVDDVKHRDATAWLQAWRASATGRDATKGPLA
ncbi:MAG: prephenate dehydratase [Nitriliruptoraceae bacterium]